MTDEELQALKRETLTELRDAGITSAKVEFAGCGDSGQIESIELSPSATSPEIAKSVEEAAETLIQHYANGYENNEGGGGTLVFEPGNDRIVFDMYYYETVTNDEPTQII